MKDEDKTRSQLIAELQEMRKQIGALTRFCFIQEISNRKRVEEQLRRNERMLRRIMDIVPSMIFTKNAEGRFLMVNRAIAESLSMTVDELEGRLHRDVHPDPDEVERMLADDRKAMESKKSVLIAEESYKDSTGATRWLQTIKVPCDEDEFGEPAIVGLAMDITERKQMEQTLKENEKRLIDIVSNVPGVVYQHKADQDSLSSSKMTSVIRERAIEMFGLDSEMENFFEEFVACLPEKDRNRFPMSIKKAIEAEAPWHYEGQFTRPSGETIWIEGNSVPRKFGDDLIFYGVFMDITQRKKAEESLRITQYIVDKAPIGIWRMGENGEILDVNEQACASLGYTREELCRMTITDFDPNFDTAVWADNMASLKVAGTTTIESLHQRKNGEIFPIEVIQNRIRFEDHRFHLAFIQDITERKQSEAALLTLIHQLKESEARFKALHNASFGGIAIHDKGLIIECNQGLSEITGYSVDELIGMDGMRLIAEESREMVMDKIVSGCEKPYETKCLHKTGKEFPVRVNARAIPYRGKQVRATEFKDITDEKIRTLELQMQVAEKEKAMKELAKSQASLVEASRAAGMAEVATNVLHNVGNVLNSINTSVSILESRLKKSRMANIQKVVDMLPRSKKDLADFLTHDPKGEQIPDYLKSLAGALAEEQQVMLDEARQLVTRIDHAKKVIVMQQHYGSVHGVNEPLSLEHLIEDAIRMNSDSLKKSDISLERRGDSVPTIVTDRHQVLQILVNLISNAKNACNENKKGEGKGHIIVSLYRQGQDRIQIQVKDNGVGIAAENLSRIFQHGFTTRRYGHGFGLHSGAISAKQLGGSLTAESDGPGCGATFTLALPLSTQEKK